MQIKKEIVEANADDFQDLGSFFKWSEIKKKKPSLSEVSFDWWGRLETLYFTNGMEIGLLRMKKSEMTINKMERHLRTAEILIPIDGDFVVPVCSFNQKDKRLIPTNDICGYYLNKDQCMILKPGIWHWAPFPLQDSGSIVLMFQQGTPENDLEFRDLEGNAAINF